MSKRYTLLKKDGKARRGRFVTPHGTIETPVFMNVGTLAAIKGAVSSMDLKDDLVITYVNLHDDTVEGFKHKLIPVEGVQFVPEMRPDLMDSENAIVRFVNRAREYAEKTGVR